MESPHSTTGDKMDGHIYKKEGIAMFRYILNWKKCVCEVEGKAYKQK